jgi:hypothetical protein
MRRLWVCCTAARSAVPGAVGDPSACGAGFGGSGVWRAAAPSCAAGTDAGDVAGFAAAEPMTATTLFTGTVSPSLTRISDTTPAAGDGISASTLSVEISNSGSSRSILSPTFLIQRTIVPSAIDSPICGMTTSVAICFFARLKGSRSLQPEKLELHYRL